MIGGRPVRRQGCWCRGCRTPCWTARRTARHRRTRDSCASPSRRSPGPTRGGSGNRRPGAARSSPSSGHPPPRSPSAADRRPVRRRPSSPASSSPRGGPVGRAARPRCRRTAGAETAPPAERLVARAWTPALRLTDRQNRQRTAQIMVLDTRLSKEDRYTKSLYCVNCVLPKRWPAIDIAGRLWASSPRWEVSLLRRRRAG